MHVLSKINYPSHLFFFKFFAIILVPIFNYEASIFCSSQDYIIGFLRFYYWCFVDFTYSEFYEPNALMMEEEGAIIAGLLVGLNVIDANFCMKGEDLDSQVCKRGSVTRHVSELCYLTIWVDRIIPTKLREIL